MGFSPNTGPVAGHRWYWVIMGTGWVGAAVLAGIVVWLLQRHGEWRGVRVGGKQIKSPPKKPWQIRILPLFGEHLLDPPGCFYCLFVCFVGLMPVLPQIPAPSGSTLLHPTPRVALHKGFTPLLASWGQTHPAPQFQMETASIPLARAPGNPAWARTPPTPTAP